MGGPRSTGSRPIDGPAFEQLFRQHRAQVLRFCLRRTGDPATAEDLCSAVFYEAWRRREEVDLTTRSALPWLYGVAHNVIRNERRSHRRYEAAVRRLPRPRAELDSVDDIAERVDASARSRVALARLRELPPAERDVLVLCVARDWTYRAAATALSVPVGTVRSRLARARARLGVNDMSSTPC